MKIFRLRHKLLIFILALTILCYGFFIEPYRLKIEHLAYDYTLSDQELTVVQFSDVHLRSVYDLPQLAKIVEAINEQAPDIVVFTGDLIDKAKNYANIDQVSTYLAQINANYGKFAIWGNHDYGGEGEKYYADILQKGGFRLLCNESEIITLTDSKQIKIIGLDELILGQPDYTLFADAPVLPTILLCHEPDAVINIAEKNLPFLTLAGHSHGGQVYLPIIGAPIHNVYAKAYYYKSYTLSPQSHLYVNTGLGTTAIPIRIGVTPSISVFQLKI